MAEHSVNFDENNLISLLNTVENNPGGAILNPINNINLTLEGDGNMSSMMIEDQIMQEQTNDQNEDQNILPAEINQIHQVQVSKDPIEASNIPENESGPQVESPTTGENFTFKCVFCEQILTFSDDPKLLECLHNSCANCINNKLYEQSIGVADKGAIECSLCNLSSQQDKIIENQFLLEASNADDSNNSAASKASELKCSSCTEDILATSWCVDCAEFICDSCVQAHQRLKITKDHTIKPKDEGMMENHSSSNGMGVNLYCEVHPHEKLSLFCENCDKLTCRDCQLIEHREHKYKFTNEIASEARKYISDMLKDVGYKRVLLTSAMKVIDDRQTLITEKKQALVKEITQLVVKLTNTINVRGKQLVAKLSEVCDSKQKTLHEKKNALEQLSRMTDYCIMFTQHALENGSDMALLYSKKQVTEHLKRIKCRRADIPNPEIPVRIHLALDKVPDLVKVMSTIGQIVVDGRIYPSQEQQSPHQQGQINMIPPIGSPSPGHSRPPQQQSPISQILQQNSQGSFQGVRPPPYRPPFANNQQFSHQNMSTNIHQQSQAIQQAISPTMQHNTSTNIAMHRIQNMGPPAIVPMSSQGILAQQLNSINLINRMQRPQMQRPMLTRGPNNSLGLTQHQQQVSSSTHPQGMMQDRSALRGLLQPNHNPVYVQTGPSQYQAIQPGPHLAQFHARFPGQTQQNQGGTQVQVFRQQSPTRMLVPGNSSQNRHFQQQQSQQQHQQIQRLNFPAQGAKWHIPQQASNGDGEGPSNNRNMSLPAINDNFKITLKQQNYTDNNKNPSATVTSTIPKTPSPNHIQGRTDTERNLDKCCEDSVKDLMATIAKLDSNGVQVLAEGRQKSGGSPHVDSSTGDATPARKVKPECLDTGKDDPNEDWCAVCMDGGELVCCDKCPKVFHQYCHIPNLSVEETGDTWQCLLCMNFADIPETMEKRDGELSLREKKIAERLVLELYCQYDPSLPFREIIGPENIDYHAIIKNPIALDTIRQKLKWDSEERYRSLEDLVRDVRLMFRNAYNYNSVDSLVYQDAKTMEKFFDEQLEKFLPEYAYENFEDDGGVPPNKKVRRMVSD